MPITHQRAAIVSIGDELILGQAVDTNASWIAGRLTARAVRVIEHATVDDDRARIAETFARLATHAQLLVVTGGLGPTADDLTRHALADAMGETLVEDERGVAWLEAIERRRGGELSAQRRVQALRPDSARLLENESGSAPGVCATIRRDPAEADVFCLPGPPREMRPMFERFVEPGLRPPGGAVIRTKLLRTFGLPEATVASRLGDLMDRAATPTVGTTASGGVVTVRIRAEGPEADVERASADVERRVRAAVGEVLYAEGDGSLAGAVIDLLRERSEALVVVESCTSGLLGALIGDVPGASDVFPGGWITYANAMKTVEVGVPAGQLAGPPGAVSRETAEAMAAGALRVASERDVEAHHALAITGVAGPGGGSAEKPVGTVFIARASADGSVDVRRFLIAGDRADIRERSAMTALGMLWRHLRAGPDGPMTWQIER